MKNERTLAEYTSYKFTKQNIRVPISSFYTLDYNFFVFFVNYLCPLACTGCYILQLKIICGKGVATYLY